MYLLKSIINFCDLNYPLIYANNIYKIKAPIPPGQFGVNHEVLSNLKQMFFKVISLLFYTFLSQPVG